MVIIKGRVAEQTTEGADERIDKLVEISNIETFPAD